MYTNSPADWQLKNFGETNRKEQSSSRILFAIYPRRSQEEQRSFDLELDSYCVDLDSATEWPRSFSPLGSPSPSWWRCGTNSILRLPTPAQICVLMVAQWYVMRHPSSTTVFCLCCLHKVEAWKLRGNVPHHVEATALLTDAILHDDAQSNSIFSIRATYSAAFCR